MITFTTPALLLILFTILLFGVGAGIWLMLNKIK
jgi:hypothetical protein